MARKVQELPSRSRSENYPYDEWFDGDIWEISQDEDFPKANVNSMRANLQGAAKRRGLKLTTRLDGESIVFQASPNGNGALTDADGGDFVFDESKLA